MNPSNEWILQMDGWMRLGDDWCESKGIYSLFRVQKTILRKIRLRKKKKRKRKIVVSPFPDL